MGIDEKLLEAIQADLEHFRNLPMEDGEFCAEQLAILGGAAFAGYIPDLLAALGPPTWQPYGEPALPGWCWQDKGIGDVPTIELIQAGNCRTAPGKTFRHWRWSKPLPMPQGGEVMDEKRKPGTPGGPVDYDPPYGIEYPAPQVPEACPNCTAERTRADAVEKDLREVIRVAHKHGWNGVENSKILWNFLDNTITETQAALGRAVAVVEKALGALGAVEVAVGPPNNAFYPDVWRTYAWPKLQDSKKAIDKFLSTPLAQQAGERERARDAVVEAAVNRAAAHQFFCEHHDTHKGNWSGGIDQWCDECHRLQEAAIKSDRALDDALDNLKEP